MRKILSGILALLLGAGPAAAQTAALTRIGVAGAVRGRVEALAPAAQAIGRVISSGKELYLNDKVTTDANGRLQIMLLDQTVFTIGPNSAMKLDEFVYDPKTDSGKVSASILKGVFRFITGKLARKDPSTMKVQFPVGTVGIRGTIVAGIVEPSGMTTVVLLGPGVGNNAGERPGAFTLENAGAKVTVSEPGFGSHIDGAGAAPSAPAPVPQQTLNAISGALAPQPAPAEKGGAQQAAAASGGSQSAGDQAGQTTAVAAGSLAATQSIASASQALASASQTASQAAASIAAPGFASGTSTWDQVRTVTGSGSFSASGPFTLNLCNGTTCIAPSSINNWSYNVSVDFGARQISGTAQINAYANNATVVDNHAISMAFGSLAGNATFCCTGSGATYNFALLNANGFAAKQLQGDSSFDNTATNPTNATKGTGATLISTRQ